MNKLEIALNNALNAVRAAQQEITNQESTYAQLDEIVYTLEDMIEDKVWD